ncbi:MAG: DUF3800 domain-containing protein [Alphaproteobacteria bacterium]|nr:DUF3800 domain-containing protein [Alphaproteobacteria bacterium]MBU2085474.1 DUF3800 domain-containing protein [Alphaproteobacteria bacterium]MBU2143458.1 DUF3800 domain-containing protein [Alphaproteobacteria bacterium]
MAGDYPYDYIAYIDEAGDPGLRRVKPMDENGSSEWLVLAGVIVDARREPEAVQWGRDFVRLCGTRQTKHLHFRNLSPQRQILACEKFSQLPLRAFVVCSNKKNMKGWKNPFANAKGETLIGRMQSYNWFYYWLSRILLEKMTDYVYRRSTRLTGHPGLLKIEFSERGGIRYDELDQYYRLLREHDWRGTQFITYDSVRWEVTRRELIEAYPHNSRAGLVLPDIVASSFFAASDKHDRNRPPDPHSAFRLDQRMARRNGDFTSTPAGYGVKLIPSMRVANLDADQARIFKHYGYVER